MLNTIIGDLLREKMDKQGYSTITLAQASGYSQSYISKLLNGDIKKVSIDILEKVLKPLGLTVIQFLQEVEKKKQESVNLSLTRAELEEFIEMLSNDEKKKSFIRALREKLPSIPDWLKFENHVKYVQENFDNDPRIEAAAERVQETIDEVAAGQKPRQAAQQE